jgi:L-asparaginase II
MIRSGTEATQLHNNCSGKHAGMLALALHIGAKTGSYLENEHPVQKMIRRCVADFTGIDEGSIPLGTDGCSAPNFAVPVAAMAASFARLVSPPAAVDGETRDACRRIVAAMTAHPHLVGGSGRLDTQIMKASGGRLISKVGAEGVYLAAVLPSDDWPDGLGIAFKVEDGDDFRARPAIAARLLSDLGLVDREAVANLSPMPVRSRRGDVVGSVVPAV